MIKNHILLLITSLLVSTQLHSQSVDKSSDTDSLSYEGIISSNNSTFEEETNSRPSEYISVSIALVQDTPAYDAIRNISSDLQVTQLIHRRGDHSGIYTVPEDQSIPDAIEMFKSEYDSFYKSSLELLEKQIVDASNKADRASLIELKNEFSTMLRSHSLEEFFLSGYQLRGKGSALNKFKSDNSRRIHSVAITNGTSTPIFPAR
ncbi:MAG: hypothetical protein AB8B84_12705 [Granulosicoccus sp.]